MGWQVKLAMVLALLFLGTLPQWPYSRRWTSYPSAVFATLLAVFAALCLLDSL